MSDLIPLRHKVYWGIVQTLYRELPTEVHADVCRLMADEVTDVVMERLSRSAT